MLKKITNVLVTCLLTVTCCQSVLASPDTYFTYQGRLLDNGAPATDGSYDFTFVLYTDSTGGTWEGTVNVTEDVIDGYFTTELDFSDMPFMSGEPKWLEISVGPNGSSQTTLGTRQKITRTPYAIQTIYPTASSSTGGSGGGCKIGCPIGGGMGSHTLGTNHHHANRFVAPSSETLTRLWIQLTDCTNGINFTLGIYDDDNGNPRNKLGQTIEYTVASGDQYQDISLPLLSAVSITAGQRYWLTLHADSQITVEKYFVHGSSGRFKYRDVVYNATLPDPFGNAVTSGGFLSMAGY